MSYFLMENDYVSQLAARATPKKFGYSISCPSGDPVDPEFHVIEDPRQQDVGFH
jgi:hypothetical protein